jgi:hypothetical protein
MGIRGCVGPSRSIRSHRGGVPGFEIRKLTTPSFAETNLGTV